jgi:ribosomal protein L7/L12
MSKRDPLLDQLYLRLSNIVDSFNEEIQEENVRLKDQLRELSLERDNLKQEKELLQEQLKDNDSSYGEEKVLLSTALGLSGNIQKDDMQRVFEFVASNQKIKAIKHFRALTGWGLKDSKDFLDIVLIPLREKNFQ